jgi:hypothetical protein
MVSARYSSHPSLSWIDRAALGLIQRSGGTQRRTAQAHFVGTTAALAERVQQGENVYFPVT